METSVPLLFAAMVGFTHAFEADHLLAVSSMVTRRNSIKSSLKDGIYWGLGHSSTILAIGLLMIVAKVAIAEATFGYFEATVGLMLILLGTHRIWKTWKHEQHHHKAHQEEAPHHHRLAYGVGLVHGLAGSGTLVLLVMTELKSSLQGIVYLLIFGLGSIAGMLLASGVFSLPFSQKFTNARQIRGALTLASSLFCIVLGCKVMWENLRGL
ncbi:MAG: sulfite exporter TauE/SafE family protein [Saprospiraceae bacterium]|nr:sulfite exporter TauE/SafE family protein [Saprospiraceae bacterium]